MSIEAEYLRILATVETGARFTADDVRGLMEAAQLNQWERGEMFRFGLREGLLSTRHMTRTSTNPSRKHARTQEYTRTRKQVRALAAVKT